MFKQPTLVIVVESTISMQFLWNYKENTIPYLFETLKAPADMSPKVYHQACSECIIVQNIGKALKIWLKKPLYLHVCVKDTL